MPHRSPPLVVERDLARWSENALPPLHQAGVLSDSKNPRTNTFGFMETIEILKHVEQSLLRHFLGVFALAAHQPAIMKNLGAEVFHKAVKRLWFSGNQFPRQFNFEFPFQGQAPLLIVAGPALP